MAQTCSSSQPCCSVSKCCSERRGIHSRHFDSPDVKLPQASTSGCRKSLSSLIAGISADCPLRPQFCGSSYVPALLLLLILRTPDFDHVPLVLNTPRALFCLKAICRAPELSYSALMELPEVGFPPLGFTHLRRTGPKRIVGCSLVTWISLRAKALPSLYLN